MVHEFRKFLFLSQVVLLLHTQNSLIKIAITVIWVVALVKTLFLLNFFGGNRFARKIIVFGRLIGLLPSED